MPGTLDDQRNAATIYASLSSYVMTASLGVIAAQAAIATFVLDKRDHLGWFLVCMIVGIVASVVSIVFGGKGIAAIAAGGLDGTWSLKPDGDSFNKQAIACLLGMFLLLASVFCGRTKPDNPNADQIQRLNAAVTQQQTQIDALKSQCATLANELKSLSGNVAHTAKPTTKKGHR
jgi:uncharacterized coiled-coil protein SlyX